LYLINNKSIIVNLISRGIFLSKKFNKKNHKSSLVYLRAPKHFNIGKHKIFSFKNKFINNLILNYNIPTKILILYEQYFFKLNFKLIDNHNLKRINSIRINTVTQIKWNKFTW